MSVFKGFICSWQTTNREQMLSTVYLQLLPGLPTVNECHWPDHVTRTVNRVWKHSCWDKHTREHSAHIVVAVQPSKKIWLYQRTRGGKKRLAVINSSVPTYNWENREPNKRNENTDWENIFWHSHNWHHVLCGHGSSKSGRVELWPFFPFGCQVLLSFLTLRHGIRDRP